MSYQQYINHLKLLWGEKPHEDIKYAVQRGGGGGGGGGVCTSRISKHGDEPGEEQRCSGPGLRSGGPSWGRCVELGQKKVSLMLDAQPNLI